MNPIETIENLRKKPEHYKKSFAFGVSAVTTGVIFVGWLLYMTSGPVGYVSEAENSSSTTSPIASLRAAAVESAGALKDLVNVFKENKVVVTATSSAEESL